MNSSEQIDAFYREMGALINRYRCEFNLTYAAAVGVLEMHKWELIRDGHDSREDSE